MKSEELSSFFFKRNVWADLSLFNQLGPKIKTKKVGFTFSQKVKILDLEN